ncbi:alpha-1,3-glucanase [Coprinopsis sp. MPI-PUGE-AT-0042]|nr:alpha-1,3-glucanase [Coprinopsis sp. MPI-PUGE-AT-0042]
MSKFFPLFYLILTLLLKASAQISKPVLAHFIVGNSYPYTYDTWLRDVNLAASHGFDGFALNVGRDDWQNARVADAFQAARDAGFKLALSFDMTSFACESLSDADPIRAYINEYHSHEAQLTVNEKPLVLTFGGQFCQFGQSTVDQGWSAALKQEDLPPIHFMPAFFIDPSALDSMSSLDGAFSWDSAWPMGNYDISNDYDVQNLAHLGGRTYMAGVSPWFFTHYGPDSYDKNLIYRSDNWLLAERWEMLIKNRDRIDMVQVISWNDYGESHYMGPIEGDQPQSESWTTGFDHQAWLYLQEYYIAAYKTGQFPFIPRDSIFLWGRLYPALADAPNDPVAKPSNYRFTEDFVWAVVLLSSDAQFTLSCGDSNIRMSLPGGLSKVRLHLDTDCHVRAVVTRNSRTVLDFSPEGYAFQKAPPSYNFNAFATMSPWS